MTMTPTPLFTTNTLNKHEKARLVRSTRKLEAIFGTTPHFAEVEPIHITLPSMNPPPSPRTKAARRHGSVFDVFPVVPPQGQGFHYSSSTNSSLSSLTLLKGEEPHPGAETLPTPKSFSSRPRRPVDPPQSLLLRVNTIPASPSDTRIPRSPTTASSTSTVGSPVIPDIPRKPSEAEIRRRRMAKLARTFGENVPTEYVFPDVSTTHSRRPSTSATPTISSRSESQQKRRLWTDPLPRPATSHDTTSRTSSQVWTAGGSGSAWSGEWNRKDIREVQSRLRALRAK